MTNGPSADSRSISDAPSLPVTRQVCPMMESRVSWSGRFELSTARISRSPSATVRRRSASSCLAFSRSKSPAFSTARPICRPMAMSRAHSSRSSDREDWVLMIRPPTTRPLAVIGTPITSSRLSFRMRCFSSPSG